MNLISAAIHNPVKVAVGVILVVVFGIVGLLRMPIQLAPEVEVPRVTVETRWQVQAPSKSSERSSTNKRNNSIRLKDFKLESESSDSSARIVLEFPVGSDIDATMLLVSNRLNQVKEYPANADRPVISKSDSVNNRPIAWFMLRPRPGCRQDQHRTGAHVRGKRRGAGAGKSSGGLVGQYVWRLGKAAGGHHRPPAVGRAPNQHQPTTRCLGRSEQGHFRRRLLGRKSAATCFERWASFDPPNKSRP